MRNPPLSHLLILLTLFHSGWAVAADTELPFDSRTLIEVHTLEAFPKPVIASLESTSVGPSGVAAKFEKFNDSGDRHSPLPSRRFYAGGVSPLGAVLIYEQGGQPRTYRAIAFVMTPAGWSKVHSWNLGDNRVWFRDFLEDIDSVHYPDAIRWRRQSHIERTRPGRREGPLREANLSDDEAREIQALASQIYPGAILNISGVVTGCPCEEGTACSDQVWVVARSQGRTDGLQLSRVGGVWAVGTIQQWWLNFTQLQADRNLSRVKRAEAVQSLWDRFPVCTQVPAGPER